MSVYINIPPINPVRWVEKDTSFTDDFGSKPFGFATFEDGLDITETNSTYLQPFKKDNVITSQFSRTLSGGTDSNVINIYSERAVLLHTITLSMSSPLIISGNTEPDTGEQLYTYKMELVPSLYSQLDDYDVIVVELVARFDTEYKYLRTIVPLYLFTDNDNFTKIEYSNNTNNYGAFWSNKNAIYYPTFQFWIEADRMKKISASEYTTYTDMNEVTEKLYGQTVDKYVLTAGNASQGIPEYMVDLMDKATVCDNVRVNGIAMTLVESGESGSRKPLQTKEYIFEEKDSSRKYQYRNREIDLWDEISYPYAVGNITLEADGHAPIRVDARILDNDSERDALIAIINARALVAKATGTASVVSGTVKFINGANENFALTTEVVVCPDVLNLVINVSNAATAFNYTLLYPNSSITYYHICNFGVDSSITGDLLNASSLGQAVISNTYASTGNYTIRIFHKNQETVLNATQSGTNPKITSVSGDISSVMERVYLRNHNFSAAPLALTWLGAAKDRLDTISIVNSQLDAITTGWISGLVTGTPPNQYKPFYRLERVELIQNTLSQSEVDTVINEIYNYARWQPKYGTILTKYQTPSAPPTATSASARSIMTTNFWTFITD